MKENKTIVALLLFLAVLAVGYFISREPSANIVLSPEEAPIVAPVLTPVVPGADQLSGVARGQAAVLAGRLGEAEQVFAEAVGEQPESPEPRVELASVFVATDRFDLAVEELHEVFRIDAQYIDRVLEEERFAELRRQPRFVSLLQLHNREIPEMYENTRMPAAGMGDAAELNAGDDQGSPDPNQAEALAAE